MNFRKHLEKHIKIDKDEDDFTRENLVIKYKISENVIDKFLKDPKKLLFQEFCHD